MHKKSILLFIAFFLCSFICFAQNWDINLLKQINVNRYHSLDSFFKIITDYAAPIAYSVPFLLLLFAIIKKRKILKAKSIYIIQSAITALIISTLIKHIVNRPRPYVTYSFIEKITGGSSPSFPSGHTSDAFTLAASLSFAFPKWYIIIPSYVWAAAVGYSRMDLGVHYPSDVLASIIIGIFSAFVCYELKERREKKAIESDINIMYNQPRKKKE